MLMFVDECIKTYAIELAMQIRKWYKHVNLCARAYLLKLRWAGHPEVRFPKAMIASERIVTNRVQWNYLAMLLGNTALIRRWYSLIICPNLLIWTGELPGSHRSHLIKSYSSLWTKSMSQVCNVETSAKTIHSLHQII